MRSDCLLTNLGNCSTGPRRRLWLEDSYSRLTHNGFEVGTGFTVQPRPGPGLYIRPALLSSTHVSKRNGAAILSYEGSSEMARFGSPEVRVKLSIGLAQVLPSLRVFSVRVSSDETWTVDGATLRTPSGSICLVTGMERPSGRPRAIEARLDASNLVAATALIAWAKPATVRLACGQPAGAAEVDLFGENIASKGPSEADITFEVARQFLVACGWTHQEGGVFER